LRLSSFGGYGLALAALALVVFRAYDSYPINPIRKDQITSGKCENLDSSGSFCLTNLLRPVRSFEVGDALGSHLSN